MMNPCSGFQCLWAQAKALTMADKAPPQDGCHPDLPLLSSRPPCPDLLAVPWICFRAFLLFLRSGTLPPRCPQGNSVSLQVLHKHPLPTVAFLTVQLKMTTYPQHSSPSLFPHHLPTLLLRLLAYGLSALLEHKLHEGRGFALSTAGSLELRSVPSTW